MGGGACWGGSEGGLGVYAVCVCVGGGGGAGVGLRTWRGVSGRGGTRT